MTRTLVALLAVFLFTAGTGCVSGRGLLQQKSACHACGGGGCQSCGILGHHGGGTGLHGGGGPGLHGGRLAAHHCDPGTASGPPAAQVAYPYYTVRGPRDFFLNDPPPLGP